VLRCDGPSQHSTAASNAGRVKSQDSGSRDMMMMMRAPAAGAEAAWQHKPGSSVAGRRGPLTVRAASGLETMQCSRQADQVEALGARSVTATVMALAVGEVANEGRQGGVFSKKAPTAQSHAAARALDDEKQQRLPLLHWTGTHGMPRALAAAPIAL
jgi:hypothetical protein